MRTSVILSIAAALAAVVVVSSDEASARSRDGGGDRGPRAVIVRDHRAPKVVNIRDHRATPKVVNIRDHRTPKPVSVRQQRPGFVWVKGKGQPGHWERARAESKSVPVVRDHRKPATPVVRDHRAPAPVVRDHRRAAGGGVSVSSGPARQKSGKTYSFRPFGVPPLVTIRR